MLNFGAGAGWEAVVASATGWGEGRDLVGLEALKGFRVTIQFCEV